MYIIDESKCSCCDTEIEVSLRDLGFEEYIPMCNDCFVEDQKGVKTCLCCGQPIN